MILVPSYRASVDEMNDFDQCACYNTRRAARLLARAYDRALEPSGLRNTQFAVLAALASASTTPTITELGQRMGVDRTTLTRNLRLMVDQDLVRLEPGADARAKCVEATPRGLEAFERAAPLWADVQEEVTAGIADWSGLRAEIRALGEMAATEV